MKKRIANLTLLILVALALIACEQPYVMTNNLGGQTLSYSNAPYSTETWTFAKDGKSGTVELQYFDEDFPTAAAATTGNYDGREWYQYSGVKGKFTYDPKTLTVTLQYEEVFWPKAGTSAPYYKADYEWKNMSKLAQERGADSVTIEESYKTLFTQDNRLSVFSSKSGSFSLDSTYTMTTKKGADVFEYVKQTTRDWKILSATLDYSNIQVVTNKTNGSPTRVRSYDAISNYEVKSAFELGATKTGASFADTWQKGKTVSFSLICTNSEQIEYEGTTTVGTKPNKPTVDPQTGIGLAGSQGSNPLNYYFIYKKPSAYSRAFVHHGDFITEMPYTAHRGIAF